MLILPASYSKAKEKFLAFCSFCTWSINSLNEGKACQLEVTCQLSIGNALKQTLRVQQDENFDLFFFRDYASKLFFKPHQELTMDCKKVLRIEKNRLRITRNYVRPLCRYSENSLCGKALHSDSLQCTLFWKPTLSLQKSFQVVKINMPAIKKLLRSRKALRISVTHFEYAWQ